MIFIFNFVIFIATTWASLIDVTDAISKAYVDPTSNKKTILFQKSFESHRSDGRSDLDFFKGAVSTLNLSAGDELHIILQSDGGEISVGLNINAFLLWLRDKGVSITTRIPKNGFCHSICLPVFAAGTLRLADPDATFIVHPATFPEIIDVHEKQQALDQARSYYLNAISAADPEFAKYLDVSGFLEINQKEFFAKDLVVSFPTFLKLFGNCSDSKVSVVYKSPTDYDLACQALEHIRPSVQKEFAYKTDASISIEFKESVLFSLFDSNGVETSKEPVYGLYDRKKNKIEMSSYDSSIVQNLNREHFSLKIQVLPISDDEKKNLLLELHQSIIIHELTHLFTQHNFVDDNPSSAIHEYFSYVIQLKSLSPKLLTKILSLNPQTFTNDLQINSMIHFSGPHQFGVMSYKHFEGLGERKEEFIRDALSGEFRPDDLLEML